jgi:hypothetical protein
MLHAGHFNFAHKVSRALLPLYVGPFKVTDLRGNNAVVLQLPLHGNWPKIHPVFNVDKVVHYHMRPGSRDIRAPEAIIINNDGSLEYEVEAILDHGLQALGKRRRKHGHETLITHYLVRWKAQPPENDTWEPVAHLANASVLVQACKAVHGLTSPT